MTNSANVKPFNEEVAYQLDSVDLDEGKLYTISCEVAWRVGREESGDQALLNKG